MASYYYLISSLPDLRSDGTLPLTYKGFLGMCQGVVGEKTYRLLEELTLASTEGPLIEEWARTYGAMRKELNYQRRVNLGQSNDLSDRDPSMAQMVSTILSAGNPLNMEKIMLDYEFQLLDSLVGLHMFDDYVLFGYAIKLKLLERQNCFEHDKGEKEFRRLMDVVQKRVYSLE